MEHGEVSWGQVMNAGARECLGSKFNQKGAWRLKRDKGRKEELKEDHQTGQVVKEANNRLTLSKEAQCLGWLFLICVFNCVLF